MTIKEMRTELGMNQKEFAQWLGMPIRNIQNWEQGSRQTSDWVLKLIQYYFDHEKDNVKKTYGSDTNE